MLSINLKNKGFTLVEILVVVAIIGILTAIVSLNFDDSKKFSRDEKRQSDLRAMQSAVELYKNKYGRYPEQCAGGSNGWSGQPDSSFACSNTGEGFILGNSAEGRPFSEFMPSLPKDPKLNGNNSGYVYRVSADGAVYKLMVMNTVESEIVGYSHPLKSCDIIPGANGIDYPGTGVNEIYEGGLCSYIPNSVISSPITPKLSECTMSVHGGNGRFDRSYGVWGGFLPKSTGLNEATRVRDTTRVICR